MRASLRGLLTPASSWTGRILGLYSRALSLLSPDGNLITLLERPEDMEARAICLGTDFRLLRSPEIHEGGTLFFVSTATDPGFGMEAGAGTKPAFGIQSVVDLELASLWDPRPRLASLREEAAALGFGAANHAPGPMLSAGLALLSEALQGSPPEGILGSGLFGRGFERLVSEPGFPANLVGYGPGTTPAGDDFIAGWSLAACLLGLEPCSGISLFEAVDLERTSPAGRSLLSQVRVNCYPETHLAFAEAWIESLRYPAAESGLRAALGKLLSHGASSGYDFLVGFYRRISEAASASGTRAAYGAA